MQFHVQVYLQTHVQFHNNCPPAGFVGLYLVLGKCTFARFIALDQEEFQVPTKLQVQVHFHVQNLQVQLQIQERGERLPLLALCLFSRS